MPKGINIVRNKEPFSLKTSVNKVNGHIQYPKVIFNTKTHLMKSAEFGERYI